MAAIACLAVVLIVLPIPMPIIHFLLIVRVAKNALENFIVRGIHVTGGAALPLAAMLARVNTEILSVMIEGRRFPGSQRVTRGAVMRKIQRHMIRTGWPLKIRLVA
jgi:hypothetical protein